MKIARRICAFLLVFGLLFSTPVVWASASTETQIVSQQLSLGDDLTMRFAVATDNANASIWVTVGDNATEHKVSEITPNASGHYVVSVELAAAQMTDAISVQVKDGDSVLTEGSYSIRDYCAYILEGSYDDATKQMVKEVLNYGAVAQEYFQYNTGNPANTGYVIETTAQIPTDIENMSVSDSLSGISFYGATLLFRSKVAIRYYFSVPDGVMGYTFTANGKTYEATKKDELYYVEVAGINPQQLDQAVTLEVTDGTENTLTVSYSPLHYMARMSAKDTTPATLKALLTAMYSYHLEACEYVGLVETDDREVVSAQIVAHEIVGPWLQDRVGSSSIGPEKSYDGEVSTKWNPQAADFASGESIVYELDRVYDLTQLQVTVSSREFFFEVAVSADGKSFVTVHTVTEENMASVYTDLVCTLSMADADAVRYVKLTFLGSNATDKTNTFVNLNEVTLTGRVVEDDRAEVSGTIIAHEIVGTWVKDNATSASVGPQLSYDGVSTTKWNSQATNYKSGEGIVYTLEKALDLTKVVLTFGSRQYYFTLHVSSNGTDYTQVAAVTADDAAGYDSNYVCTVDGLSAENVKYIKILFTGNAGALNTYVNLFEVAVSGKEILDTREEVQSSIVAHELVGTWTNGNDGSASLGPQLSYDGSNTTNWQGQATNYTKGEGIVYTLDSYYDLTKVQLAFKNRQYYFTLHASANGTDYTQIAEVTADNQADYFTDLTCTVEGLDTLGTKYLKVLFTGNEGTLNTYIGLHETEVFGKRTVDNREIVDATIIANEVVGTWGNSYADSTSLGPQKSYDGDTTTTFWQGQATNYKSGEGIVYTLDNVYDLSEVKLYFRNRQYYFDMYVSSDGSEYTQAASVTADNQADYFVDQVCTISDLTSTGVKYIKILFTGNEGTTNLFLGLYEIQISGKVGEIVEGSSFAVSGVFSSNMVLQREQEIPVWGWADEGDTITGTFAGNTATAKADANGEWKLTFPAQSANAEAQTMKISCSDGGRAEFGNILIGDVYIVNGQSNAELPLQRTAAHLDSTAKEAVKELFRYDSNIRLYNQQKSYVVEHTNLWAKPQADVINPDWAWAVATENEAFWTFSALGMYFAKNVRESLSEDIPIGLIHTAAGGAYMDELMPNELNAQFGYTSSHTVSVGGYYNTMIHPFVGYPIAGMLYFQGESNNYSMAANYARDLSAYITELRARWGQEFNFYNVQLSSYGQQQVDNNFSPYLHLVRNEQYQLLGSLDNYYLTVSMDVGYRGEIDQGTNVEDWPHPKDKKTLGERIAKQALAVYYKELAVGEDTFSPVPSDIQWGSDGIIISFENANTLGLAVGDTLVGFQCVINEEAVDVAAQIVNGNQVKLDVDATTVSEIRYAMFYLCYPENANLVNAGCLPAPAFAIKNPGSFTTNKVVIKANETSAHGWKSIGTGAVPPELSYDGDMETYWNAQINSFAEKPWVTYYLNKACVLDGMTLTFINRQQYFTLYTSTDGSTFTEAARITAENYTDYVATLDGLNISGVVAIRLEFTGSSNNTLWVNFHEIELDAVPVGPEQVEPKPEEPTVEVGATIIGHELVGTWTNGNDGSASLGPQLSYDGSSSTNWQGQATNYTKGEGIVYTLDGYYDLTKVQLTFKNRQYYFTLHASTNGTDYTQIAEVTADNQADYFTDLTCTVEGLDTLGTKYLKVLFAGNEGALNAFVGLYETEVFGRETVDNREVVDATIIANEVVGTWTNSYADSASLGPQKSYDGDTTTTYWQGQATNYKSGEGVVYTLDAVYDLSEVTLYFRNRQYYFDMYVSSDGDTYTQAASVTADNQADYFADQVCTISDLTSTGVKYIKILFTGNEGTTNLYLGLYEIQISGKAGEVVEGSNFAVSGVFSSNMVLQREQEIPVWGWADEGDTVTGTFAGNTATATADANGAWKLTFPAQSANATAQAMTLSCSDGTQVEFENILIGDVYIINGQSNAELAVNRTAAHLDNAGKEAVKELFRYDSNIRLFHQIKAGVVERTDLWAEPQANVINSDWTWAVAAENDAFWTFSALGMYFAKNVRDSLSQDIPIGLIQTAAGGAYLDELMPNELNAQFGYTGSHTVSVGGYYNTMIHPFVGYPIAGMLYFQGESNNYSMAANYARDLSAYITELRTRWGQAFNFYNVQLSSYGQYQVDNNIWPYLPQVRNEQYQVLNSLDNYYLTVSMDVGYAGEVDQSTNVQDYMHPKDKKTLGERIAKQAKAVYYGELAVGENSFSPVPSDIQWNTDGIIISFENADTLALATGDSLVGFQCVINEEVVDVAAQIVNGNQVKLAIDATTVSEIRYAMFSLGYPENANLVNGSGLPAPAFVIANPGEYMTTKIVIKRSEPSTLGWKSLGVSAALPYHSYDGKLDTYWNPQVSSFSEEPSITYYLNKAANIYGLSIPFMNRQEYFTLYASTDGSTFNEVAQITANNYTDYVCTVGGLNLTGVTAIKIVFTGSSDGSTWIGLYEVELNALPSDYEESVITKASFVSHNVVGTWVNADSENAALSYDSNSQTAWNPEASDYTAGEGIVYELDGIYNLNKLQLSFGSRKLYMNISVSTDGSEYTSVAQITAANAALYYNGNVCTVTGLSANNVRFIKVEFTGSSDESNYIDLFESVAEGEEGESAEPTEPEDTRQEVAATVTAHELVGTWAKDNASSASLGPQNCYDGDASSKWNPTATSYNVGEGIIFTLDKAYDLTKVEMTFGSRNYYFDLSVSTDGQTYTKIAEIRSSNAAAYYTDYVFMMDTLSAENVKYIKIEFVGSSDAGKFVNFFEIAVTGKESVA